ncbi:hypothetical protein [Chryseobacterium sp.]|uniref:hypothetical protein n=1 Tax=Chryseobacterium sp. TaxID=1871047 RepID=UPI002FC6820C
MKTLFKNMMELLKTIPNLYVAENWGQLDMTQPPVNFPCALLDLGDMEFSQRGSLTQQGEGILTISLADIMYNGIDNVTTIEKFVIISKNKITILMNERTNSLIGGSLNKHVLFQFLIMFGLLQTFFLTLVRLPKFLGFIRSNAHII